MAAQPHIKAEAVLGEGAGSGGWPPAFCLWGQLLHGQGLGTLILNLEDLKLVLWSQILFGALFS